MPAQFEYISMLSYFYFFYSELHESPVLFQFFFSIAYTAKPATLLIPVLRVMLLR